MLGSIYRIFRGQFVKNKSTHNNKADLQRKKKQWKWNNNIKNSVEIGLPVSVYNFIIIFTSMQGGHIGLTQSHFIYFGRCKWPTKMVGSRIRSNHLRI